MCVSDSSHQAPIMSRVLFPCVFPPPFVSCVPPATTQGDTHVSLCCLCAVGVATVYSWHTRCSLPRAAAYQPWLSTQSFLSDCSVTFSSSSVQALSILLLMIFPVLTLFSCAPASFVNASLLLYLVTCRPAHSLPPFSFPPTCLCHPCLLPAHHSAS